MQTELYDLKIEEDVSVEANLLSARSELKFANKIGLRQQAHQARRSVERLKKRRNKPHMTVTTQPLNAQELAVWRQWLPRSYEKWELRYYEYDRIPVPVMEQWAELKKARVFQEFEIRTPERVRPDPALFGHRDGKVWLIARWAESDERLISFEEIAQQVRKRVKGILKWTLATAIVCLPSFFAALFFYEISPASPIDNVRVLLEVLGLVLLGAVGGYSVEEARRSYRILRTIR